MPTPKTPVSAAPTAVSLEGRVIGRLAREVVFRNETDGILQNLSIQASCHCVRVILPRGAFSLAPGESKRVRFTYEQTSPAEARQAVSIRQKGHLEPLCLVPVQGRLYSVLRDPEALARPLRLERAFTGDLVNAPPMTTRVRYGYRIRAVRPLVEWADAKWSQKGDALQIRMSVRADEDFDMREIPFSIDHEGPDGSWVETQALRMALRSRYVVRPAQLWLGRVAVGRSATAKLVIEGDRASSLVKATLAGAASSVAMTTLGPDRLGVQVRFSVPREGLFERSLVLSTPGKPSRPIVISGLAGKG